MIGRISSLSAMVLVCLLLLSVQPVTGEPAGLALRPAPGSNGKSYTAYNLWYEKPAKVPCMNYPVGVMLPVGTELESIDLGARRGRPLIRLTTAGGGIYTIHFQQKYHGAITPEKFMERIVTNKRFEELTEGMKDKEIKAIKEGRLVVGMSKKAVVMCRGYPPEHVTPELTINKWVYWQTRFKKKYVEFDENGRTRRPSFHEDDF